MKVNPINSRQKTLGTLLTELRSRLGFATSGTACEQNKEILVSFLQEGQRYVFDKLDSPSYRKRATITTQAGEYLYDWNNDEDDEEINPSDVLGVYTLDGESDSAERLVQGISYALRTSTTEQSRPERYDDFEGQIELFPVPDRAYSLVIEYNSGLGRFELMTDRPNVPDYLVLLYALTQAKHHYQQPDAQTVGSTFTQMLAKENFRRKEGKRYFAKPDRHDLAPFVSRGADGTYTLTLR